MKIKQMNLDSICNKFIKLLNLYLYVFYYLYFGSKYRFLLQVFGELILISTFDFYYRVKNKTNLLNFRPEHPTQQLIDTENASESTQILNSLLAAAIIIGNIIVVTIIIVFLFKYGFIKVSVELI
jgi:hypothetical protein